MSYVYNAYKTFMGMVGGLVGYLLPVGWLILACVLVVLYDAYSAFELSKRVKRAFPGKANGKFKSLPAQKIPKKLLEVSALIALAFFIDDKVVIMADVYLPYIVAGVFIFVELWSILENMSSCNDGNKWARVFQKIMVDKTARHFDIDPEPINHILNETDSDGPDTGNSGIVPDTAKN